jgi:hypothetical protein
VTSGFLCTEKVSAGQFTVPAWVLSSIPKSDMFVTDGQPLPGGVIGVGTSSFTNTGRFSVSGLDFSVLLYEQATANLVLFQ